MASYYVYSGAGGAGTGADWANAYTTLATAISGKSAGDVFYFAHDHAESTAGNIFATTPGSKENPCRFLCVNRAGSVPPVSADLRTTGTITVTGNNNLGFRGQGWYVYGLVFVSGGQISIEEQASFQFFQNCKFTLTGTGGMIAFGGGGNTIWDNCVATFSSTSQNLNANSGDFVWRNTANAVLGTIPTTFIQFGNYGSQFLFEGVDLSAVGTTLVSGSSNLNGRVTFKDCKVHPSVTFSPGPDSDQNRADFIRCDSGATNYRTQRSRFTGTLTTETTIIRTGGASDGTTPISWKIVTTADSEWQMPFEAFPISIWNDTTGSAITVTVEGVWGGGAVPLNDEIWMDVEYLGDASYPQGSFATTTKADILATGTNTTASSETWGGSTTKFKLVASVTPQMKGPITVTVKAAKVSSTFYIDPKITLT